jgi:hypothetical protein
MNATANQPEHDHERRDADVTSLLMIVLILFISGAMILLIVAIMMHYFNTTQPPTTTGQANIPVTQGEEFPQPRLEVKPGASLADLNAAEDADLNSYGWIDRNAQTVRIPIDRAIQLIVERGLPDLGPGKTPLSLMQARPAETASPQRLMENR